LNILAWYPSRKSTISITLAISLRRYDIRNFELPENFHEVEVSRSIPTSFGKNYWLRFPSPSQQMNDLVYARVYEPEGVDTPLP